MPYPSNPNNETWSYEQGTQLLDPTATGMYMRRIRFRRSPRLEDTVAVFLFPHGVPTRCVANCCDVATPTQLLATTTGVWWLGTRAEALRVGRQRRAMARGCLECQHVLTCVRAFVRPRAVCAGGVCPDEYGVFHESGHHFSIPFWECLNEPDSEHHHTVQEARSSAPCPSRAPPPHNRRVAWPVWTRGHVQYTLEYDAMVAGIRRWADPEHRIKFVGLALANPYLYDWCVACIASQCCCSRRSPLIQYAVWRKLVLAQCSLVLAQCSHTRWHVATVPRRLQPVHRYSYFLNASHHTAGTPLDFISYHHYGSSTSRTDPDAYEAFFDQADAFIQVCVCVCASVCVLVRLGACVCEEAWGQRTA